MIDQSSRSRSLGGKLCCAAYSFSLDCSPSLLLTAALKSGNKAWIPTNSAYNNMGVAYGRMNDPAKEREALEKAISLDDHFVPAFVNLAKLSLREHDSGRAEALLENALRTDPTDAETMTLLAEAQLLNGQY